jgi:hypothetical protein
MSLLKEKTDSILLLHVYSTRGVCFLATLPIAMNKKDEALGEKKYLDNRTMKKQGGARQFQQGTAIKRKQAGPPTDEEYYSAVHLKPAFMCHFQTQNSNIFIS